MAYHPNSDCNLTPDILPDLATRIYEPFRKSILTISAAHRSVNLSLCAATNVAACWQLLLIFFTCCRSPVGVASSLVADPILCPFRKFALTSVGNTNHTLDCSAMSCAMLQHVAQQRTGLTLLERDTSATLDTGTCPRSGGARKLPVGVTMPACLFSCSILIAAMDRCERAIVCLTVSP